MDMLGQHFVETSQEPRMYPQPWERHLFGILAQLPTISSIRHSRDGHNEYLKSCLPQAQLAHHDRACT